MGEACGLFLLVGFCRAPISLRTVFFSVSQVILGAIKLDFMDASDRLCFDLDSREMS